ncbi:MAG: hypothetical protein JRI23_24940 [Deltaproteobacteria bacterium]|jgi:tRNA (guanosine-2'-O-)-methyltransferase|nr:hypothetical protein [Deltaproteobacteria bacterium]MBW2535263.1 hypothetical protein [Deltaproteobacteria bacterium]
MRAAALGVALALASGCLPEVQRPKKATIDVRDVEASEGVTLETACVPSGPERCFDAVDDNCNGVIDEGCGLQTGILQFAIAWTEPNADVDLNVSGPDGELARYDEPTESGLLKDRDCPGSDGECRGQNVENVFLVESAPRRGRYRVVVRLEDPSDTTGPIRVRLSARIGQRHFTTAVELTTKTDEREFAFTL